MSVLIKKIVYTAEIVDAILEQDGTWEVTITEGQTDKTSIMKVLRNELNMTIPELKSILNYIDKFKFQGTRAEVLKLQHAFKNVGVIVNTVRLIN